MKKITGFIGCVLLCAGAFGQKTSPFESFTYKQVDTTALEMRVYKPAGWSAEQTFPAIVFFFGGGWNTGKITQFEPHALHLAPQGMVVICADYRVRSRQGTTPFEAVADARSAMRHVRSHAAELGIDPNRIGAGGGSAGGHLALCTTIPGCCDDPADDLSISPVPNALVLYNPAADTSDKGWGSQFLGERALEISPVHHLQPDMPPTLIMSGSKDRVIPAATLRKYCRLIEEQGGSCKLIIYEGQEHGFFNYSKQNPEYYNKTVADTEDFLRALGWIK